MWSPETACATSDARRVLTLFQRSSFGGLFPEDRANLSEVPAVPLFVTLSALLRPQTSWPATRSRRRVASAHLLDRSFEDLARDLEELEGLAVDASGRLGLTGRVLLRHRRDLHGDSLDLIEDHLRQLVSAYDGIRRDARGLRADAERGRRSPELLAGLAVERSGLADRLRTLQGIAAAAITASEWQSPSFAHSGRSNAGTCTGAVRPHVDDYRRDRHPDAAAFEVEYLAAYVDPVAGLDLRALVTSCGMSAFATIVGFLQMEGKIDGPVVLGASTYHECRDLLRAMVPDDALVEAPEHPPDALPSAILRHRPAAVFLDSVGNAPGTLVADLPGVVRAIEEAGRPSYLVLDNTALTCTVQPFRLVRHRRQVRLIVFESLTKYAQFGLDRVTGGAIVAEGSDAEDLDRYREHLGTNIADATVHAIPRPNRPALERRLLRIERNALVLARRINEAAGRAGGGVVVGAHHPHSRTTRRSRSREHFGSAGGGSPSGSGRASIGRRSTIGSSTSLSKKRGGGTSRSSGAPASVSTRPASTPRRPRPGAAAPSCECPRVSNTPLRSRRWPACSRRRSPRSPRRS